MKPLGINTLADLIGRSSNGGASISCGLPDGRWVRSIPEPYTGGGFRAAWWVLTGRAYAVVWPKPGDLEDVLGIDRTKLVRPQFPRPAA